MKFSSVLVLLNIFNSFAFGFECNKSAVAIAFKELAKVLFKSNREVLIKNLAEDENDLVPKLLENIKSEVLPWKIDNNMTFVSNEYVGHLEVKDLYEGASSIMVFSSVEHFKNSKFMLINDFPISHVIFVYWDKATIDEVSSLREANMLKRSERTERQKGNDRISAAEWYLVKNTPVSDINDILNFQYFMVEEKKSIKLMTFVWYTPQACHVPQLIEVNRFDKNTRKWKSSKFTIEKNTNFHGCELVIGIENRYPESYLSTINNESVEYEGYGLEIFRFLSKPLNFTFRFNLFVGPFLPMHDPNLLYDLGLHLGSYANGDTGFITTHYVTTKDYFAVPPGVPYDAYHKLILPFDLATWIWTLITFVVAFAAILIVHFMKIEVQNFVFGENVTTSSLNVLAHFFGLSQVVMPRRSFARFLVMMFILYSFMVRNLYQGMMCDNLQTDLRGSEPIQSIDDIREKNYTLYCDYNLFGTDNFFCDRAKKKYDVFFVLKGGIEIFIKGDEFYDHRFEATVYLPLHNLTTFMKRSNGKILQRILKDSSTLSSIGLAFPSNHRLFEIFDRKIKMSIVAGVFNRENNDFFDKISSKRYSHLNLDEVKPMNLKHLEAGFVVWLVSLIFPIAAFIAEWIVRLKDFIVFKFIFVAFNKSFIENVRIRDGKMNKALEKRKKKHVSNRCDTLNVDSNNHQLTEDNSEQKTLEVQIEHVDVRQVTVESTHDELIMIDL